MTPQPQEPLVTTSSSSKLLEHISRFKALENKKRSYVDFTFPSLPPRKRAIRATLLSILFPSENLIRTQPFRKKENMNTLVSAALASALITSLFIGFLFSYTIIPALIVASSMMNLGLAIYDYVKTPKNERTPLQKFNLVSSSSSILLTLGLLAAAICLSLAVPGAAFAFLAIIPVIAGFKYWQSYKARQLKKQEDMAIEKGIEEENQAIEDLKPTATSIEEKIALKEAELEYFHYALSERRGAGLITGKEYIKQSDLEFNLENELRQLRRLYSIEEKIALKEAELESTRSALSKSRDAGLITGEEYIKQSTLEISLENELSQLRQLYLYKKVTTAPSVTDASIDTTVTVNKTECSSRLSDYSGTLFAQPNTFEGSGQPVCLPPAP